jgi:broad specificity phosphatase PhoE
MSDSCQHPVAPAQVTPLLAERYFGSALELTSHDNYCPFWDSDARDPSSRPAGSEDGESVEQVSQRVHQLFQVGAGGCRCYCCCWACAGLAAGICVHAGWQEDRRGAVLTALLLLLSVCLQELELQHQGQHILLVSHGDTLSILQATFHGSPLSQHRQYGLATAELKCLNPPREAAAAAGSSSRELAGVCARS